MTHPDDGRDLVFVTGAAGSKWTAVAHALAYCDGIDNSDVAGASSFDDYFGPGMEFGASFAGFERLEHEQLVRMLSQPFTGSGGTRLVKSRAFAAHLHVLQERFPAARIVVVHRSHRACLEWWLDAVGFGTSFPDYTWSGDAATTAAQIADDDAAILEFVSAAGLRLRRHRSMTPIAAQLGLRYSSGGVTSFAATPPERRFGLGDLASHDAVLESLHARARVAQVACYTPTVK